MSDILDWLDNPYRTIIEYCSIGVIKGVNVLNSLTDLQELMGKTENKVAEARINKALGFIKEKFSQDLLDDNDEIIQNGVIVVMKMKLK